jgi:hypothetical protein
VAVVLAVKVVGLIVKVAGRVTVVVLMVVVVVVKVVPFATSAGEREQLCGVQDARAYGKSSPQHHILR